MKEGLRSLASSMNVSDLSTDVHLQFDHILDEQAWDVNEVLWQDHIPNLCALQTPHRLTIVYHYQTPNLMIGAEFTMPAFSTLTELMPTDFIH